MIGGMSADHAIDDLQQDADARTADAERDRVDGLFLDIFETDRRGAEVFEVLFRRFARTTLHTVGGIDAVLKTYQSAAHRELLDYIVLRCNRARGVNDEGPP